MPRRYRKKQIEVEAVQYTGANQDEIKTFCPHAMETVINKPAMCITTLSGVMLVPVKEWVIKGVLGEFYPCAPDIFALTYDPVEQALDNRWVCSICQNQPRTMVIEPESSNEGVSQITRCYDFHSHYHPGSVQYIERRGRLLQWEVR